MREYAYSLNYNDPLLAELYDQTVKDQDDVLLLRRLIGKTRPLKVLECFSGTGRIAIPLAFDGHFVTGIDIAGAMQDRAQAKMGMLNKGARSRITLLTADVLDGNWGRDYDLVVLGANCFYELPSSSLQKKCVAYALEALKPEGLLFIDNEAYKGDWARGPFRQDRVIFEGTGADGTYGRYTQRNLSFDYDQSILHLERKSYQRAPSGAESVDIYTAGIHPVSAVEVEGWLNVFAFEILHLYGNRAGDLYTPQSPRAIFWARRKNY